MEILLRLKGEPNVGTNIKFQSYRSLINCHFTINTMTLEIVKSGGFY